MRLTELSAEQRLVMSERLRATVRGQGTAPLTVTQEGIWLAESISRGASGYHDIAEVALTGPLDVEALRRSLAAVTARHQVLRAGVSGEDGYPFMHFDAPPPDALVDDRVGPPDDADPTFELAPFDLQRGPLWRWRLRRVDAASWRLTVVLHHLITDGWSVAVLFESLLRAYSAGGLPLDEPAASYAERIVQRVRSERRDDEARAAEEVRATVAGLSAGVDLAPAAGKPALEADVVPVPLTRPERDSLERIAAHSRMSGFTVALAVFAAVVPDLTAMPAETAAAGLRVSVPVLHRSPPDLQQLGCFTSLGILELFTSPGPWRRRLELAQASLRRLLSCPVSYRALLRGTEARRAFGDPLTNLGVREFNVARQGRRVGDLVVSRLPRRMLHTWHDLSLSVPSRAAAADAEWELLVPRGRWTEGSAPAAARLFAEQARSLIASVGSP